MMRNKYIKDVKKTFSGTMITLEELIDLRALASQFLISDRKAYQPLMGQNVSLMRGRGIDFHTLREYQAGDDIRSMAWRVTARSMKPFVKVYQEEKERQVWFGVDLSPSLYFGTRCLFKSVKSIQQATLLGWHYLLKNERIGAIISAQNQLSIYEPNISEKAYLAILNSFAEHSRIKPEFTYQSDDLYSLLMSLQQRVRSGNLIFILSDFYQFNEREQALTTLLAARAQVVFIFIYDPFEESPPPPARYRLTNGENKMVFNMDNEKNRFQYQQQFKNKKESIIEYAQKHHIALHIVRTDQQIEDCMHG